MTVDARMMLEDTLAAICDQYSFSHLFRKRMRAMMDGDADAVGDVDRMSDRLPGFHERTTETLKKLETLSTDVLAENHEMMMVIGAMLIRCRRQSDDGFAEAGRLSTELEFRQIVNRMEDG